MVRSSSVSSKAILTFSVFIGMFHLAFKKKDAYKSNIDLHLETFLDLQMDISSERDGDFKRQLLESYLFLVKLIFSYIIDCTGWRLFFERVQAVVGYFEDPSAVNQAVTASQIAM